MTYAVPRPPFSVLSSTLVTFVLQCGGHGWTTFHSSAFPKDLERDAVSSTRALSPADITHFLTPHESVICSYRSSHFLTLYN